MANMFEIIVENAILQAKTTILEEAAGTQTAERYVYIVEAAGDTLKKAKDFVVKNKGKLAALAGAAALAGGAYYAHQHGMLGGAADKMADLAKKAGAEDAANKLKTYANTQDVKGAIEGNENALSRLENNHGQDAALAAEYAKKIGSGELDRSVDFQDFKNQAQEDYATRMAR